MKMKYGNRVVCMAFIWEKNKQHNMKNEKNLCWDWKFAFLKYDKFFKKNVSIAIGQFIEHTPIIFKE